MAIIDNNHDFNAEAVDPIQGLDKQTLSLLDSNAPALCRCLGKKNLDTGMDFLEMLEYARNYAKTDGGHEVSEICRTIYKLTTSIRDPELDKGGKVKDMRNLESTFKMLKREVIRLQSQEDLEKSSSSIIDVVVEGTQNDAAATFEEKEGVLEEENEEDSEGFDPDKTMQGNDTMNYEQDLKVVVDPKLSAKRKSKVPTFDKGQVDAALQLQEDGMKSMQSMLKNISGMLVKNQKKINRHADSERQQVEFQRDSILSAEELISAILNDYTPVDYENFFNIAFGEDDAYLEVLLPANEYDQYIENYNAALKQYDKEKEAHDELLQEAKEGEKIEPMPDFYFKRPETYSYLQKFLKKIREQGHQAVFQELNTARVSDLLETLKYAKDVLDLPYFVKNASVSMDENILPSVSKENDIIDLKGAYYAHLIEEVMAGAWRFLRQQKGNMLILGGRSSFKEIQNIYTQINDQVIYAITQDSKARPEFKALCHKFEELIDVNDSIVQGIMPKINMNIPPVPADIMKERERISSEEAQSTQELISDLRSVPRFLQEDVITTPSLEDKKN